MVCELFFQCHKSNGLLEKCNKCVEVTNESKPSVSAEGRVSHTIANNSRQTSLKYKVDNGLIHESDNLRCDYVVMFPHCMDAFFIELKKQGREKALKQLENTFTLLFPFMNNYTPHLRAIMSGVPKLMTAQAVKTERRLKRYNPHATVKVGYKILDEV